jgi:hypothetical protein
MSELDRISARAEQSPSDALDTSPCKWWWGLFRLAPGKFSWELVGRWYEDVRDVTSCIEHDGLDRFEYSIRGVWRSDDD